MRMSKEFYKEQTMMRTFLRSLGWKQKKIKWEAGYPAQLRWVDPKGEPYFSLWEAYTKAKRRKQYSEIVALKKAGWKFRNGSWVHKVWGKVKSRTEIY